jgi:hypothetical protein
MGVPPVAWERDVSENTIHELSAILDPDALQTLRAEGRAMTLKQAVPYCFDSRCPTKRRWNDAASLEPD